MIKMGVKIVSNLKFMFHALHQCGEMIEFKA